MSDHTSTPVVEVNPTLLEQFTAWLGRGRDWFARLIGAAGAADLESMHARLEEQRDTTNQNFQALYARMDLESRRQSEAMAEYNQAVQWMLTFAGVSPAELESTMQATAHQAWDLNEGWNSFATYALEQAAIAARTGTAINNALQWAEDARVTLPAILLPEAAPVVPNATDSKDEG